MRFEDFEDGWARICKDMIQHVFVSWILDSMSKMFP